MYSTCSIFRIIFNQMVNLLVGEIFGYIASACLCMLFIPQIKHIRTTRDASGTTWSFLLFQTVICSSYVIYGFSISAIPIIGCNSIVLAQVLWICMLKKYYQSNYTDPDLPT